MSRKKDQTPHKCNICKEVVPASGMGSHLYHKHNKLSSEEYVAKYGEFRKKYLDLIERKNSITETYKCAECEFEALTHKQLVQHIGTVHGDWKKYYIKHYFNGVAPTCGCGCGQPTSLLRHGKNDKNEPRYAREFLPGHNINPPGYRTNTLEQRQRMREAAIRRMQNGNSVFHTAGPSKREQEVHQFIQSLNIVVDYNNKTLLKGEEVDVLIQDRKIAIEYNGIRFHSDLFKKKDYHLKKTKELNELGYQLIHIWEPDWIKSRNILESNLKHILGKTQKRLYARNLEVREVTTKQSMEFLQENHLQGYTVSKIKLGLFDSDNTLHSLMTFGHSRAATGNKFEEGAYELIRFCNKLNTSVVGGASRLYKAFIRKYKPTKIYTYANRDWSLGKLYTALGMVADGITPPGYFYVKSNIKYSRQVFQKHKLVEKGKDPNKTEYEIMTEDGYYRVWDCGNLKYVWVAEEGS
jgi:very-short-patch-repair endonuclease